MVFQQSRGYGDRSLLAVDINNMDGPAKNRLACPYRLGESTATLAYICPEDNATVMRLFDSQHQ